MDDQGAHAESSAKDSELMSSWRMGPEETRQSSERWRVSLEPEAEFSDMEKLEGSGGQEEWDREEVEREVEGAEEKTMS